MLIAKVRIRKLIPRYIGIFFGTVWALLAARSLPPTIQRPAAALAVLIGLGFCIRLWRITSSTTQPGLFRRPAYLIAVLFEMAAFALVASVLPRFGAQDEIYSAIGLIVGLHFIGLWRATGDRTFLAITAGMCLVSLLSIFLPFTWRTVGARSIFLGAGNAVILWIGAGAKS